jgi:hypothetical protein
MGLTKGRIGGSIGGIRMLCYARRELQNGFSTLTEIGVRVKKRKNSGQKRRTNAVGSMFGMSASNCEIRDWITATSVQT